MQTVITTFETTPGACEDLLAAVQDAYRKTFRRSPGFQSAKIHVNDAQTRVAIRSAWDDRDAFKALLRSDAFRAHTKAIAPFHQGFAPVLYDVVAEITP